LSTPTRRARILSSPLPSKFTSQLTKVSETSLFRIHLPLPKRVRTILFLLLFVRATSVLKERRNVRDGLKCKRCRNAVLTSDEKDTLNGLYCHSCRQKYSCGGEFDSNSDILYSILDSLMPSHVLISNGQGIPGSATPWAGRLVKPDIVFHFSESLIVVVEADEDDGHSNSRGQQYLSIWHTLGL
jgi:hypothetical protein